MKITTTTAKVGRNEDGAFFEAFAEHPGYRHTFALDQLTTGIFLPLVFFEQPER